MLRQLVEDGVIDPRIGKVFPLNGIQQAFVARENGTVKGKVVLRIA